MSPGHRAARPAGPSTHAVAKILVILGALALVLILGLQAVKWLHVAMMNTGTLPPSQLPEYTPSAAPAAPGSGDQAMPIKAGTTFRIGDTVYGGKWRLRGQEIVGLKATRGAIAQERGPNMLTFTFWDGDQAAGNIVCSSIKPLTKPATKMFCPPTPGDIAGGTTMTVVDSTVSLPGTG
ncbi:MAG TPA: hypothetical protein P5108_00595 [Marmoricola sp.]|nr:hypothetical protein [Nocardioidaceae bacterium]MCB8993010.1 hypothetical protein [Nocardioidaceae bacterium]MCO5323499.1 hypothetical protein [Nocardioidaceae bacterium]HRV67928.1 hypothetical protein [Marmoricola sp.]